MISRDFKYPTQEEINLFDRKAPVISRFSFKGVTNDTLDSTIVELDRIEKLHAWDIVLSTKINHLKRSYLNCLVFHNRGLVKTVQELDDNTNSFVFYLDNAFYTLHSIFDIILHLINVYYDLGFEERKVGFGSEAGVAILNDWKFDGNIHHRSWGRNDLCPCGSGKKFKKCHCRG